MIEGIEALYQQIAESIADSIEDEWTVAKMEATFHPGSSEYVGEYVRKVDGKSIDFGTQREAERAFREIRKLFKAAGKPVWGRAIFELHCNGKFNMQWCYENCDENGDTVFDEEEWLRQSEVRRKRLTAE